MPPLQFVNFNNLFPTFFYIGFLRPAPGTWGSLAGIISAYFLLGLTSFSIFCFLLILTIVFGFLTTKKYLENNPEKSDPSEVVIDEVIGQWITILPLVYVFNFVQIDNENLWIVWIWAFFSFRFFDILKLGLVSWADNLKGAFTGEVSIDMLKSINVDGVILGHSERREYYNEDDDLLLRKLKVSLENNFKVYFCIGESLEDREKNNHFEKVKNQLEKTVFKIDNIDPENLVIAYEPIWAIGTGLTASPEQAQEIHKYIRNLLSERYGNKISDNTSIIYGGSVKPANAREIFSKKDVDGGLIGGASLNAVDFSAIVSAF